MLLMSTHNIGFNGEISKNIPELSPNTSPNKFSGIIKVVGSIWGCDNKRHMTRYHYGDYYLSDCFCL